MKQLSILFLLLSFILLKGQSEKGFRDCKTKDCQVKESYMMAKFQLEIDEIEQAQHWLNITKDLHIQKVKDSLDVYMELLQSEIFYYMEMFQFGTTEAEKAIHTATKLSDSLLLSDAYFFQGINQFELKNYQESEKKF